MARDKIALNKQIPQEHWVEFFDQFSNGNRGRSLEIEVMDQELGDQELVKDSPLFALVYDPVGKGNDLVIETGQTSVFYAHTIDAPTDVWTGLDQNGVVVAVSVTDAKHNQTILRLR